MRLLRHKTGPVFSLFWQRSEPISFWLLCDRALRQEEERGHPRLQGKTRPEPSVLVENGWINTTGMRGWTTFAVVRERDDSLFAGIDDGAADVVQNGFHLFHAVLI